MLSRAIPVLSWDSYFRTTLSPKSVGWGAHHVVLESVQGKSNTRKSQRKGYGSGINKVQSQWQDGSCSSREKGHFSQELPWTSTELQRQEWGLPGWIIGPFSSLSSVSPCLFLLWFSPILNTLLYLAIWNQLSIIIFTRAVPVLPGGHCLVEQATNFHGVYTADSEPSDKAEA